MQPKLIDWDAGGSASSQQDVFQEKSVVEQLAWEKTLSPQNLATEISKCRLLLAINQTAQSLAELSKGMVSITRTSRGELEVRAIVDVPIGGIAFAPAVPDLRCIAVKKANSTSSPMCLYIGDLVVSPSTKLPPRGIQLAKWDKDGFVNPFWVMERSAIVERSNFITSTVEAASLRNVTMNGEHLHLAKASVTNNDTFPIPVLVNHKPLKPGDLLVLETQDPGRKHSRVLKSIRWDTGKR
jgi:hypothetical protein